MTVRLLKNAPRIGKKGALIELPARFAARLISNRVAQLDPPDQELPS